MRSMTVSAVAMANWVAEPEKSFERMAYWVRKAKAAHSDLVLFPELTVQGYMTAPIARETAEPVPGPTTQRLASLAAELDLVISAGLVERDGDAHFNAHVLVGKDGLTGKQRKVHVPTHERPYWDGGSEISVFDVGGTKVGITVCRDSFFAEMLSTLYHKGAEVILMPFGYPTVPRSRYLQDTIHGMSIITHCWAYGLYAVMCNSAEDRAPNAWQPEGMSFPGWAGVISPWGRVAQFTCDDGNGEAMVTETLNPAELLDRRGHTNFIAGDLRPELYR